jgi:uncharacterized LabA/DUF88 family protein
MSVAWFVDGSYLFNCWSGLHRPNENLDYLKLRKLLEARYCDTASAERITEAYYFDADADPPTARQNAFHNSLAFPPPTGPGLRVKLYWLQRKQLFWPKSMGGGPVLNPVSGKHYELTQQKAVDVGLAFHLMRSFARKLWPKLFLATGDGDFKEVVQHLVENENVTLFLIGTLESISEELRPYATHILQLKEVAADISRPKAPQSA